MSVAKASLRVHYLCRALVGKQLSEESLGEAIVFQLFMVVRVFRCKGSLYYLATVVDYDVQLEAVEPSYRAFPLNAQLFIVLWLCISFI